MPPENTVHRGLECRQADSSFHPMCAGAHKKDVDSDYIRKMQSAALPGNTGTAGSSVLIYHSCGMEDLTQQTACATAI